MSSEPTRFDSDDPEMAAAIRAAKETLAEFLSAILDPTDGQSAFLLKVAFLEGEEVEHIWVADLDFDGSRFFGVIANEPACPTLHFKQQVKFEPERITDWMYVDRGILVGGYTTRLIRERMSAEERAALDAAAPYSFESA